MADLEARYRPDPSKFWRRPLPPDEVKLGRRPGDRTGEHRWSVEWDDFISGLHATLVWKGGKLQVKRRMQPEPTRNPIFYRDRELNEFTVSPGESFVIGETQFTLYDEEPAPKPEDPRSTRLLSMSMSRDELKSVRYHDPGKRIEALAALPEVIRNATTDNELSEQVVQTLLTGIPHAETAAVVLLPDDCTETNLKVATVHSETRNRAARAEFRPSRRLAFDALSRKRQSVLHIWSKETAASADYSMADASMDWAICTPLADSRARIGLYVVGRTNRIHMSEDTMRRDDQLRSDLKFMELTSEIFSSLRQVRDLQARQATLSHFFSPAVVKALNSSPNPDQLLVQKVTPVTVLFCDIRGSCLIAEKGRCDLNALWDCIREALGIMTKAIVDEDGIIGDFQGDAVMAFWGWPISTGDQMDRAARAAIEIRRRFNDLKNHSDPRMQDLDCGLGLAHGEAIAGKIGADEQFKVGAFGPVVNLAARLETMTKLVGVKMLCDAEIGQYLKSKPNLPPCRRVAHVIPKGMTESVTIHELFVPGREPDWISTHEAALDALSNGNWGEASRLLEPLNDGPAVFLRSHIEAHRMKGVVPAEIRMQTKG
jgi:adenylate cyclase